MLVLAIIIPLPWGIAIRLLAETNGTLYPGLAVPLFFWDLFWPPSFLDCCRALGIGPPLIYRFSRLLCFFSGVEHFQLHSLLANLHRHQQHSGIYAVSVAGHTAGRPG
jgi:hypothetical protein